MPDSAAIAEPTFADFRANPDILKTPPPEREKSGVDSSKPRIQNLEAAKEAPAEQTSEPVAGSDPEPQQQSKKFEARKAEMQREIDAKRRELGEIERTLEAKKAPPAEAAKPATEAKPAKWDGKDPNDPEPSATDAKYTGTSAYEDYLADKLEWKQRAKARAENQERVQTEQAEQATKAREEYETSKKAFEDRGSEYASQAGNEDYPALVDKFRQTEISAELEACVLFPEDGPGFLHFLLKNPEVMKRIEEMPKRYDRLEAYHEEKFKLKYADKLNAKPVAERPKSQAPPPGTYLNGRGAAPRGDPKSLNDIGSFEEARKLVRRS